VFFGAVGSPQRAPHLPKFNPDLLHPFATCAFQIEPPHVFGSGFDLEIERFPRGNRLPEAATGLRRPAIER